MMKRLLPLLLALAVPQYLPAAADPAAPQMVVTPRARALPVSATNRPFLAAARAQQAVNLTTLGYVETEYVVNGTASIYEWTGEPRDALVAARARGVPYATRLLVRRPADATKASGVVVMELLDPGTLYDRAPLWGLSWQQFTRRGDVWVGVTVKPRAIDTLRRFDEVRYGSLSFSFTQAAECRPAPPRAGTPGEGDPRLNAADAENGLAFDVIAQTGALLRSSSKENPLLEVPPRRVIAAGFAEASGYAITFANALHRVWRLGDGAPVFDGYLGVAGNDAAPINQCAAPLPVDDPRRGVLPRDVPFVLAMTESDFNLHPTLRREDGDERGDVFRLYEIPGSGQSGSYAAGVPVKPDLDISGFDAPADVCTETASDYPLGLALNAIWQQYSESLLFSTPLLRAPRIETDAGQTLRDANGNALGGWRLPQLDLPVATYVGHGTARDPDARSNAACAVTGVKQAFDASRLRTLYRDRAQYLAQFRTSLDQAVAERRLVKEDADALKLPQARIAPAF